MWGGGGKSYSQIKISDGQKKKICQETIRKSCLWPKHAHLPNVSINVSEQLILTRMVHTVYTQQNSELFTLVERAIWNLIMKKKWQQRLKSITREETFKHYIGSFLRMFDMIANIFCDWYESLVIV